MKPNDRLPQIKIQGVEIILQLPDRPALTFSSGLPVRRYLRDEGYSEKGWLWCAFCDALENARMELEEPEELFEIIWDKVRVY